MGFFRNVLTRDSTSFLKAAGFVAILATAVAAVIAQLKAAPLNSKVREGQGVTTELSADASAITYWLNETDGWHVVTTVDILVAQSGDSAKHAIVRFSSVLLPGQSETISVPLPVGERQQVLCIRRRRDQLEIERVTS
jgi:hypothetical protein